MFSEIAQPVHSEYTPGLVSVVMPAYNCQGLLPESIASVVNQTYAYWELLVVDDASTDESLSIAKKMGRTDSRISVIPLLQNGGVANARNVAMRAARGQYLAFLDSDDLWLPSKLSAQTEFMQRHGVGFCFTRYRRLKPGGQLGAAVRIPDQLRYHDLLKGNVIGCLTVMIDRNKVPAFTMHSIGHEDYLAWLQILKNGITAWGLQEDLARYRVSAESTSGNKQRSALWTWQILRRYEGLTLHKSMICFLRYFLRAAYIRCGL